jgi:hypothetical protein
MKTINPRCLYAFNYQCHHIKSSGLLGDCSRPRNTIDILSPGFIESEVKVKEVY